MQAVKQYWYRIYFGAMLTFSTLILFGYGLSRFTNYVSESYANDFILDGTTATLAALSVVYAFTLYPMIERRRNAAAATITATIVFSLLLMYGYGQASKDAAIIFYLLPWLTSLAMNGMYGPQVQAGSVLLTYVYVLLVFDFRIKQIDPMAWVLVGIGTVVALLSYQLWKRQYIDMESKRIRELTSSLSDKQMQSEVLIKAIADGVVVIDTSGKIIVINPAAANMIGWEQKDAMGIDVRSVMNLSTEKDEEIKEGQDIFTRVLNQKQHIEETLVMSKKGEEANKLIISIVVSPVVNPGSDKPVGAIAVFRDVSAAKKEEAQRAEFISTASHEMRTPVAAIEGYLALALNDKVSKIDSHAREYLEKAHSSTQHLGKLFQDLLTSAKAEDGRLTSHPVVVDMGAFVQQAVSDLQFSAQKKGLLMEFVLGAAPLDAHSQDASHPTEGGAKTVEPLYYAHVDPDRLREVVTNLFDNAVKYTERGKITIGLTGDQNVVQVRITDTGPGIPKEDASHLFQKFYRVDNSATRTIGGTGLGLFICRKIVELYGGRIWVESVVGEGSTFFINLPRIDSSRALQMQKEESEKPSVLPSSSSI